MTTVNWICRSRFCSCLPFVPVERICRNLLIVKSILKNLSISTGLLDLTWYQKQTYFCLYIALCIKIWLLLGGRTKTYYLGKYYMKSQMYEPWRLGCDITHHTMGNTYFLSITPNFITCNPSNPSSTWW